MQDAIIFNMFQFATGKGGQMVRRIGLTLVGLFCAGFLLLNGCDRMRSGDNATERTENGEAGGQRPEITPGRDAGRNHAEGAALFDRHCAGCHPQGGNTINSQKTLDSRSLAAGGITTRAHIVDKMRRPGPGMPRFDKDRLSDAEAEKIAAHIQASF